MTMGPYEETVPGILTSLGVRYPCSQQRKGVHNNYVACVAREVVGVCMHDHVTQATYFLEFPTEDE